MFSTNAVMKILGFKNLVVVNALLGIPACCLEKGHIVPTTVFMVYKLHVNLLMDNGIQIFHLD
jgi:hypothetical protein